MNADGATREAGSGLIPPRPNPGPEEWDPGADQGWAFLACCLAAAFLALLAIMMIRRSRRKAAAAPPARGSMVLGLDDHDALARVRADIRQVIAARLGTGYLSRTTEELEADSRLRETLGAAAHGQLVKLLGESDRLSFAGGLPDPAAAQRLLAESATWVESLERSAGARSTIKGK